MKARPPKINFVIDAVLFGSFILTFFLNLTGVALHQWLGIFAGALAGYHLLVHWGWVKSVARRAAQGAENGPWLNAVLDAVILLGLLGILGSGLVISTWLNLSLNNYAAWHTLHVIASLGTLAALVGKLALHARWIVVVAKRFGADRAQPAALPTQPAAPTQPVRAGDRTYTRREFVRLMGGVGLVAFLAAANVLDDAQLSGGSSGSSSTSGFSRGPRASSSVVQCNRGCSYPGHCRRYTDSNGNNRCDLSESGTS